jgi:hypothetical protein
MDTSILVTLHGWPLNQVRVVDEIRLEAGRKEHIVEEDVLEEWPRQITLNTESSGPHAMYTMD